MSCILWRRRGICRFRCFSRSSRLFVKQFHGLLIQFLVALDHKFLECKETLDSDNLVDDLLMDWVKLSFLAGFEELGVTDAEFGH